jgi:hypothetical protein
VLTLTSELHIHRKTHCNRPLDEYNRFGTVKTKMRFRPTIINLLYLRVYIVHAHSIYVILLMGNHCEHNTSLMRIYNAHSKKWRQDYYT